jgi:hypothetical protein
VNNSTSFQNFQILKEEALKVLGIEGLVPGDCRLIAKDILLRTTHQISETTLKRVYGFAHGNFNSSQYTANVLSEYCGYKGWKDFVLQQLGIVIISVPVEVSNFRANVDKISNFTLASLRNKSGIPYSYCLQRSFFIRFIEDFHASKLNGAVIYAPTGYGKTIALCKWIDLLKNVNFKVADPDTILFFSSQVLLNAMLTGKDMNQWIMALLGYQTEDNLLSFFQDHGENDSKFYLIIDGLDPHMFTEEQYDLLLTQLSLLLTVYQEYRWFKIILTMRTSSWANYKHFFRGEDSEIFTGAKHSSSYSNVPLLTLPEVKLLATNINPSTQHCVDFDLIEYFKYTLFFQYFYKTNKKDFKLTNISLLVPYDVVFDFKLNKIYVGSRSQERVMLLRSLIAEIDFKEPRYHIDKLSIVPIIKNYTHAYNDLISIGFLQELNLSDLNGYGTYISFGNEAFLQCCIARTFLNANEELFNEQLVNKINLLLVEPKLRFEVTKWCVLMVLRRNQHESLAFLTKMNFSALERSNIVCFLAEIIDKEHYGHESPAMLKTIDRVLVEYFLGLELISAPHRKALEVLLKFNISLENQIMVNTAMGIIDVVQLQLTNLEKVILVLKDLDPEQLSSFDINPLWCLTTFYNYLKFGVVEKEALTGLTKLLFHPPAVAIGTSPSNAQNMLQVLGMYTALNFNNPRKLLRIVSILQREPQQDVASAFDFHGFFIKILLADSYFKLGDGVRLHHIFDRIQAQFTSKQSQFTPFMTTLFYALEIKVLLIPRDQSSVIDQLKIIEDSIKLSKTTLSQLMILKIMSGQVRFKKSYPDHYAKTQQDYDQLIAHHGLRIYANHESN